jgi:hypothetical protein
MASGFDASLLTYKKLSRHCKDNLRKWVRDDRDAQAHRQSSPEAMDIYDIVKEKCMEYIRNIFPHINPHILSPIPCNHPATAHS